MITFKTSEACRKISFALVMVLAILILPHFFWFYLSNFFLLYCTLAWTCNSLIYVNLFCLSKFQIRHAFLVYMDGWNSFSTCLLSLSTFAVLLAFLINFCTLILSWQGRLLARAGDYAAAASIFQKILELWYACGILHSPENDITNCSMRYSLSVWFGGIYRH